MTRKTTKATESKTTTKETTTDTPGGDGPASPANAPSGADDATPEGNQSRMAGRERDPADDDGDADAGNDD